MTTVKVADYRNSTDHLFRVINVDYHACVGLRELQGWKVIAERVLGVIQAVVSPAAILNCRTGLF